MDCINISDKEKQDFVKRCKELLEIDWLRKQNAEFAASLERIARAAVSNSGDAHFLGNLARVTLGKEELPRTHGKKYKIIED